jgi:hypothetical protein
VVLTRRSFPAGAQLPEADDEVVLSPLSPAECFELARAVPGAQVLPEHMLSEIVTFSDGIPLFVEQLVISVASQRRNPTRGSPHSGSSAVPLTLAEMLSERLDRLPGGRRIVQAAACIGRAFTPSFLAALLGEDERALLDPLEALVGTEILRRQDEDLRNEFEFRHTLLWRVAYDSILQADRRAYHTRIVDLLKGGQDLGPLLPEVMAHHLTAAGAVEAAVDSWLTAGTRAAQRSAHVEALDHLGRGLGLLDQLHDATRRRGLEIKLHAARIGPIIATLGSTSAEMGACCHRGLELCLDGDPSPLVFPLLFGQFTFSIGRARVEEASELAKLFLALAERSDHTPGRVIGHRLVGMAHFGLGDVHGAREAVQRSLQLYEPDRDGAATHLFGQNAHVHGSALLSLALFCLGEIDAAFRVGIDALRAADELRHPHSTAIALAYVGGWVFGLSGASDVLLREARRLIRICEQNQLSVFRHFGDAMLGWALCQQGNLDQGIVALEQANAALAAAEWQIARPGLLAVLADAKRRCGMLPEARTLSDSAVAAVRVSDRWIEPEVLRIAGLIAAATAPGDPAAPALLRGAVACARRIASPVFELRGLEALMALAARSERAVIEARLAELVAFRDLDRRLRKELVAR